MGVGGGVVGGGRVGGGKGGLAMATGDPIMGGDLKVSARELDKAAEASRKDGDDLRAWRQRMAAVHARVAAQYLAGGYDEHYGETATS